MKEIAAYLLCVLGGAESPSAEQVIAVINSVGGEVDEEKVNTLIGELQDKDIGELLAKGKEDLKNCVGGSGPAAGAGAPAAAAAPAEGGAPAAKAPEKPKEEEVDALDGGMDMFGGSGGGGGGDY